MITEGCRRKKGGMREVYRGERGLRGQERESKCEGGVARRERTRGRRWKGQSR